jgi:cephalosporin hydroxylase
MSLWSNFLDNTGRMAYKWKHYFPAYEAHFERFVNRPVFILEIGVFHGGSLQLWKKYLGPHALIVGLDINPVCAEMEEDQIMVRIGDQSDPVFLQSVLDEFGRPDIVVDDGSHMMAHVNASFDFLYPRMSPTGVYFVEDMQTAYWPEFGGGLRNPDTFIERSKNLIDELNADWSRGALVETAFTHSTLSMHFYNACVVFERGRHLVKGDIFTGGTGADRAQ